MFKTPLALLLSLIVLISCLCFNSCSMVAEAFMSRMELNEFKLEVDEHHLSGKTKLRSVDRDRNGVRIGVNVEELTKSVSKITPPLMDNHNIIIFTQVFDEKFDKDFEGYGLGFGISGQPILHTFHDTFKLILPFQMHYNGVTGDADEPHLDADIKYREALGMLGVGVDIGGLQPSIGVSYTDIVGEIEPFIGYGGNDQELTGRNFGTYLGLKFVHKEFPGYAQIRGFSGEMDGVIASVGVRF